MENKYYVSYEAARLLKEKGYNEVTNAAWNGFSGEIRISPQIGGYRNLDYPDDIKIYSAPTKSEAIDWLESKGIMIDIHWIRFNENRRWNYSIFNCSTCNTIDTKYIHSTRLEAEEAAIIRALKEITKL